MNDRDLSEQEMPERVESFSITILGPEVPDDQTKRLMTSRWEELCVGVQVWLCGWVFMDGMHKIEEAGNWKWSPA